MIEIFKEKQLNRIKGNIGEEIATNFLKEKGFEIVARNFECGFGEIDIIAQQKSTTVFVEVKHKLNANFGYPREMVNFKKQQRIRKVAELYCMKNHLLNAQLRFDVIEILGKEITHIENAF